jgi:anti-anti-sigma regulatory factor
VTRPIKIAKYSGSFGGDKDAAAKIRDDLLRPALRGSEDEVVLDFSGVDFLTQSFAHALLSAIVRKHPKSLERIRFDNCTDSVREIIEIVVQYSQEDLGAVPPAS